MKNNKRGFTLVELMAVLIILALIVILALIKIKNSLKKNNEKSMIANATVFVKAVEDQASTSRITNSFEDGYYSVQALFDEGLNINGTKPDSGSLTIIDGVVKNGCLEFNGEGVEIENGKFTYTGKKCDGSSESVEYAYSFTGDVQVFTAPKSGTYRLEVWGAQGGYRTTEANGGKGGYSAGNISLNRGDILYVYVGGSGADGGYNGGGAKQTYPGGGGATDIRTSDSLYSRIIVAGGGGSDGAANKPGGYAGGLTGQTRTESYGSGGEGGTQTAGGNHRSQFGIGGNGGYDSGGSGGGGFGGAGGGGWYGGGGVDPDRSDDDRGGGGGSGYAYTADTASNYPSGCLLNSSYYLTNTLVLGGNEGFDSPDSVFEVGHAGSGAAKITLIN